MIVWADIFDWLRNLDARLWQAFIAGVFLAGGWVFNGAQNRRDARALRREQTRDLHRAIFAEIATNLSNLYDEAQIDARAKEFASRIEADPQFVPFIPRPARDRIFRKFEGSIHILPRVTIDRIVRYYFLLDSIDAIVEDMRGDTFRTLEPERRKAIMLDYFEMQRTALFFGRLANSVIAAFEGEGAEAAMATEKDMLAADAARRDRDARKKSALALNTPDAGRSDP